MGGVSHDCADCYAQAGKYSAANCKADCLLGWCKSGCLSCSKQAAADAATCSGIATADVQPCDLTEQVTGGTLALTLQDCGDASTHGKITDIDPKALTLGAATTITGSGSVDEAVSGGTFTVQVHTDGTTNTCTGDVCAAKTCDTKVLGINLGQIEWSGLSCPQSAGPATVPLTVTLPSVLPAAALTGTFSIRATATSGDKLLCGDIAFKKADESVSV